MSEETNNTETPQVPNASYDFVGHITYDESPEIIELLIYHNKKKTVNRVEMNGKVIYEQRLEADFVDYLREEGYTVTKETVPATNVTSNFRVLTIPCTKTSCPYHGERFHKVCKIKVKAMFEVIIKKRLNNPGLRKVLVTYKARDMRETTTKADCIVAYIKEQIGIEGEVDSYGKMELC